MRPTPNAVSQDRKFYITSLPLGHSANRTFGSIFLAAAAPGEPRAGRRVQG